MRTFTTEHTVYTFDELSKEAQQKAIEDYREGMGFPLLEEDMTDQLHTLLKKNGITPVDVQVRYSLGYSQGDGASFTGDIEWKSWRADVGKNHWGHHYAHWNSVDVVEMTSLKTDKEAPQETYDKLDDIVHSIGRELEVIGYKIIEEGRSDKNITELILANEYEFYENGKMY